MELRNLGPWIGLAGCMAVGGCYSGITTDFDFASAGGADAGADDGDGDDGADDGDGDGGDDGDAAIEAPPSERAQLRRLTRSQYGHALEDLLGSPLQLPEALEPDLVVDLFATVGAAQGTVSSLGTEQFEAAAEDVADQVFDDATRRSALVGCDPATAGCLAGFAESFGRRVFRRPLSAQEAERYGMLAEEVAALRADPWEGGRALVIALLSSPNFLYQIELGEQDPDDETRWRFTSIEMASRLAFALWNGPPDEALLAAGEAGELLDAQVIREQSERMLADDKAQRGIKRFAAEWLGLDSIANLDKDDAAFPTATPELFASMHGEVTRLVEDIALSPDGSTLDLVAGTHTFVDATLADFYGVALPNDVDADGFGRVELTDADGRRGILGTAGVLASQSRRTRTAPTLRGLYVQERLRCQPPPPPPPDVPMDIPTTGDDGEPQTIRELLEEHRQNPTCAACHDQIDPPGLAMENYDAIGAYRTTDSGFPVDAKTELEATAIDGLPGLADYLAADSAVDLCLVRQLYRFTIGHRESVDEADLLVALTESLGAADHNLVAFIPNLMIASSFRTLAPPAAD